MESGDYDKELDKMISRAERLGRFAIAWFFAYIFFVLASLVGVIYLVYRALLHLGVF